MKKALARNLVKGWKTSLLGIIILLASITSVFVVGNITWFDASIGIAIGLGMLFCPDDILKRITVLLKNVNKTP